MLGYDPILLDFIPIVEWLKESEDNFVILDEFTFEKRKVEGVLLKKSYFLNENPNDIYNICILSKNGDLLPKDTFKHHVWRNIGKYLQDDNSKDKYQMVFDEDLIKELKKKNNVYNLISLKRREQFISRELLEMSTIGTLNSKYVTSKYQELYKPIKYSNLGFLAFEDAFFDAKISEALQDYGDKMYHGINGYLRYNKLPDNYPVSLSTLQKKISPSKDEPIVLIPFTCNAKSGSMMNHFDHNNKKKLNTIYQELVKNR